MLFTTQAYAAFFIVVFCVHWFLPAPLRRLWLLIASYYFYTQAIPQYGWLIAALTVCNYSLGLAIWATHHRALRRMLLIFAIVGDLGTLVFYKYAQLLARTLVALTHEKLLNPGGLATILLPLGISFFTFEFIHYVVEVHRGTPPIRNPIDFALFAAFFPTQIAGPIKRFPDWVKQRAHPVRFAEIRGDVALWLIVRGVFKKIVVADGLAPLVAAGFNRPDQLGFLSTWFVLYAFAAQIYADFSGYTDIGRGCAMLLGFSVPENFNRPYQSRDPGEFWQRWHISLSSWLRDYLYIPLGGSRVPLWRVWLNLMITMALGGLWHGASWHFLAWGCYQGVLLVGTRIWALLVHRVPPAESWIASRHGVLVGRLVTFHLVCLGWLLFRGDNSTLLQALIHDALIPARHNLTAGFHYLIPGTLALPALVLGVGMASVAYGWVADWLREGSQGWMHIETACTTLWTRWQPTAQPVLAFVTLAMVLIWPAEAAQRFIYFQF